jgi:hypothetical protein
MCKKPCKECPWNDSNQYKWQDYIKEKVETGKLPSHIHRCHMITNETFSDNLLEEPIDNVCVGSFLYNKHTLNKQ